MDGEGDNNQPPVEGGEPAGDMNDGGPQEDQQIPEQQMDMDGGMDPGMDQAQAEAEQMAAMQQQEMA